MRTRARRRSSGQLDPIWYVCKVACVTQFLQSRAVSLALEQGRKSMCRVPPCARPRALRCTRSNRSESAHVPRRAKWSEPELQACAANLFLAIWLLNDVGVPQQTLKHPETVCGESCPRVQPFAVRPQSRPCCSPSVLTSICVVTNRWAFFFWAL